MSFENRYRKHKTFIENRWQPIDVKVLSEEDPKKKVILAVATPSSPVSNPH